MSLLSLFAALFLFAGFYSIWHLSVDVLHGKESVNWSTAYGTVSGGTLAGQPESKEKVTYKYKVGEKEWQGNTISFPRVGSPHIDEGLFQRLKYGNVVRVYYDPKDPAMSCLKPSVNLADYNGELAFRSMPILLGMFMGVADYAIRQKKKREGKM